MRVLCTTQPGNGHFHTVAPVAAALRDAGHDVRVACAAAFAPAVAAVGFPALPCGFDWLVATSPYAFRDTTDAAPEPAGREWLRRQAFLHRITESMLDDLLAMSMTWRPDLVVREAAEFAGCVAAECWGIPHAVVGQMLGADYGERGRRAPLLALARARGPVARPGGRNAVPLPPVDSRTTCFPPARRTARADRPLCAPRPV